MTAPSQKVRTETMRRDGGRCQAADETCWGGIEWQHREATGQGGRGSKAPKPKVEDGIALCKHHNDAAEGAGQRRALYHGWKIRRFRGKPPIPPTAIPWFDRNTLLWYLPYGIDRGEITQATALELLELAGNFHVRGEVA